MYYLWTELEYVYKIILPNLLKPFRLYWQVFDIIEAVTYIENNILLHLQQLMVDDNDTS